MHNTQLLPCLPLCVCVWLYIYFCVFIYIHKYMGCLYRGLMHWPPISINKYNFIQAHLLLWGLSKAIKHSRRWSFLIKQSVLCSSAPFTTNPTHPSSVFPSFCWVYRIINSACSCLGLIELVINTSVATLQSVCVRVCARAFVRVCQLETVECMSGDW